MNLVLGTAQFGRNYGVANDAGKVSLKEIDKMLNFAYNNGIKVLDTSSDYGNSETILGNYPQFDVVSKIYFEGSPDKEALDFKIKESKVKLNRSSLKGYMVQNPKYVLKERPEIFDYILEDISFQTAGASIYSPEEFFNIVDKFKISCVQFPSNVLDQRFLNKKFINYIKNNKVEIYVRSIFLQGLLLMNHIPNELSISKKYIENLTTFASQNNVSKRKVCIEFVKKSYPNANIVFGANNLEQLKEIVEDYNSDYSGSVEFSALACNDKNIINPGNWNVGGWKK